MSWFFIIFSTLAWGIAEIFYKKGSLAKEKYSHLKITILVGFFMGIYATIILFTQGVSLADFPANFVRYLPVSACYIVSMVCSYFGVRFIEESISDPIENSSIAIVPVLSAIFLHEFVEDEKYVVPAIICIVIVVIGILGIGFFDKKGKEDRTKRLGKKFGLVAIAMPFCYMILDAVGTFLDIFYVDVEEASESFLINCTAENLEHTANCAYEFTFLLVAIVLYIFIRCKGEKLFSLGNAAEVNADGTVVEKKWYQKVLDQKWKILAAIFETAGQATYLFALGEGPIAAVILGAGTVVTSVILSKVFLKEKLSWLQYVFIVVILGGVIALAAMGL